MLEEARRASADADLDSARDKRTDPEAELTRIEGEVRISHRQRTSQGLPSSPSQFEDIR